MNTNRTYSPLQPLLIERPRLLDTLNRAIRLKLTLVIAPPGYGKTTLVSQFIQTTTTPIAWQTLEKWDQDVPTLFKHSLKALSDAGVEISTPNPIDKKTAGELAILITDYLRDKVTTDFIYIIDDVHNLIESPDAEIWLRAFMATMPPVCHLILIGRSFPALSLTELVNHRELISIGKEQLKFSFDEVRLLAEKVEPKLSTLQIDKIFARMLGWPAGSVLALQPLPVDIEAILFDGQQAPEALFNVLADQLFQAQSFTLQKFLLSSSTLSRMTPALCQEALGLTNSLEYLIEALDHNLFISEVTGGFIYHSLFREFLQHKFQTSNLAQFTLYHANTGKWFEAENRLDEAFEHYVLAKYWKEAANIAELVAQEYMAQGKIETLLQWENELSHTNTQSPRLLFTCAMIYRDRYEYELAASYLEAAAAGFESQGNVDRLPQIILLRATIDNQRGDFEAALLKAEPYSRDISISSNLCAFAIAIMGTSALYLRRFDVALLLLEKVLPTYREIGDTNAIAQLLMTNGLLYSRLGRFSDAATCVQESITIRRSFGESAVIGMALNNLGYQYHLLGEYRRALQTLQEGLQIISRVPENRVEAHLLSTLADLYRDQGAFNKAASLYRQSLQIVEDNEPFLQATVLIGFATLRRWEGKLDEAKQLAIDAQIVAQKYHLSWEYTLANLVLYAIRVQQGEFEAIQQDLEDIIADWLPHPSPQFAYALGIYAYGALLSNDNTIAHQHLKLAIANATHIANIQPLIAEIIHTPLLKAFVEDHTNRYEMLQQGILAFNQAKIQFTEVHESNTHLNTRGTYSLRVSAFGHECVERDTRLVALSDWQAVNARELFFYLLFRKAATREEIGLDFWPDSSSPQLRNLFHSTLHRARDAVGTNVILCENELYYINWELDIWCDVHQFEDTIKQAQLSSFHVAHTEILWQRAIELYSGDFLIGFDSDWITAYREKLSQLNVKALVSLAKCVRLRGDLQQAIDLLKKALEVDPFGEDIHRLLLKDYHSLGEHGLITRHMKYLTQLYRDELGTTVSPETLSLVKTLLG
jgi:ATP/maltotriose-dependent transcriptional regulator MalT/two-component SAPR family response regulator